MSGNGQPSSGAFFLTDDANDAALLMRERLRLFDQVL
jgi:hypothetical protein